MIKGGKVEAVFGKGDICVISGCFEGGKRSIVGYKNQSPARKIGEIGEIKTGEYENITDLECDIVMYFDKTESIDVVIKALQEAKEHLQKYKRTEV